MPEMILLQTALNVDLFLELLEKYKPFTRNAQLKIHTNTLILTRYNSMTDTDFSRFDDPRLRFIHYVNSVEKCPSLLVDCHHKNLINKYANLLLVPASKSLEILLELMDKYKPYQATSLDLRNSFWENIRKEYNASNRSNILKQESLWDKFRKAQKKYLTSPSSQICTIKKLFF